MGLYETLTDFYDGIFPVNPSTVSFIGKPPRRGAAVLDIGCATGGHALALAEAGWMAVGLEPSRSMVAKAKEKAANLAAGAAVPEFVEGGMLDIDRLFEPGGFTVLLCLGNTLPHLDGPEELQRFVGQARRALVPGGRLLIQMLNYHRILSERPGGLPAIKFGETAFERSLRYRPDGRVDFETRLTGQADQSDVTILYPFSPSAVAAALAGEGFELAGSYGSWTAAPFNQETDAFLVLDATGPGS